MTSDSAPRSLRMLVLVAAPLVLHQPDRRTTPIQPLNAAQELEEIDAACKQTDPLVAIHIQTEIATVEALNRVFGGAGDGFDIVHFSGHGSASADGGALVLEDTTDLGAARLVGAQELRALLGVTPCRLAFLSACHSEGLAAALLESGATHVVAINADDAILDVAARVFARRFYHVLLSGRSVKEAFDRAVQEVRSDDTLRGLLDDQTLQPINLTESVKFRLLPADAPAHLLPIAPVLAAGEVRFHRPPWGERTNLSVMPQDGAFFVGRQVELHELTRALRDQRCVLIGGMGGMGKTALAEAAGRWQHERAYWPDGVVEVQLRNIESAAAARVRIVSALEAAHISIGDTAKAAGSAAALAGELRDRKLLLILDDLDALLAHDPEQTRQLLGQLLGTRALRLLLTSRRKLTRQIVHRQIDLSHLAADAAFMAFRSYAPPDSWGDFTEGDQAALPQLLADLAGYPFAIRLAAAYIQDQRCGVAGLLERLRATPRKTLIYVGEPESRETSLAAALNLSYAILPPAARAALPALALFPAGLSRTAARSIFGADGEAALETLHRYAMAERREDAITLSSGQNDPSNLHRFVLPEPARRYAEQHQAADLLDQHAPAALAYFETLIATVDELITDKGQAVEGRQMLTLEQLNWQLLLDWGYAHEQEQSACRSARATAQLANYWTLTGEQGSSAALERLQQALAAAQRLHDRLGEANTLRAIGDVQQFRDDRDAALASYQHALTLYRATGDRLGEANTLAAQSRLVIDSDMEASRQWLEQALDLRRAIGDVYGEGADLGNYGIAFLQRSRPRDALIYLQRARELFVARGLHELLPQTDRLIGQAGGAPVGSDMAEVLGQFEPLLQEIAAVARGDTRRRADVEAALAGLEAQGWHLSEPVRRLWMGEQDAAALTTGLDAQATALMARLLELIGSEPNANTPTDNDPARQRDVLAQRANAVTERALTEGSADERAGLAAKLDTVAEAYAHGDAADRALAEQLRALAGRLRA